MKLSKHLKSIEPENLERMQKGFNRFRFGFAEVGETLTTPTGGTLQFLGNFAKLKDAKVVAEHYNVKPHSYLYGSLPRGWTVYKTVERFEASVKI